MGMRSDLRFISAYYVSEPMARLCVDMHTYTDTHMASGPITSWQIDGEMVETVSDFVFWAPKSLQMVIAAMKLKDTYSLEGKL